MRLKIFYLLLIILCFQCPAVFAQQAAALDSLKLALTKATSVEQRITILDELSRVQMNVNPAEGDETGAKLIGVAEETRDRKLMFKAYLSNGIRCSYLAGQKIWLEKSISFFTKALDLARTNRMPEETGAAYMHLSGVYLVGTENEKALNAATQAFSLVTTLGNDSLRAESYNILGQVYLARNEKILALRNYLNALRQAESIRNPSLIRNCYGYLSAYYTNIEDYDRAIDFMSSAYKKLDEVKEKNVPYQRVIYVNSLGNLYAQKKNYDIAISYFERSIRMADSLHYSTLKIPGYISLLNQYLRIDEPQKALNYLNSKPGDELKNYLAKVGMGAMIDQAYGVVYTELGMYDSAKIRLDRAKPMFEHSITITNKINFYAQYGSLMKKSGNIPEAIRYYLQVKALSDSNGLLETTEKAAKHLDTLYRLTGNQAEAGRYRAIYYQYKDSIETLKREKEMVQVEAEDEQQRTKKALLEEEERKRQRNNIQYLAIVIGIISLFVSLAILGMFKVSRGLIKAIGFFVFLMFFEFIFLIFKKNIYSITHGEPWKDLAFMIALAAILVPLHHWLEHKVLHYLTSHNRLTAAGNQLRNRFFRRSEGK